MIEKELTIDSNGNRLSATLCLPAEKGKFPALLFLHGSGPLDRDGNMPGQRLDIFNAIAHYLAGEGVASLRYDKRGCGKSSGDYYRAGHSDLVDDAVNCLDALGQSDQCISDRLFVLGHSEGTVIAPQVSLKRPAVSGLVLLCPFVDDMESMLIKQATRLQAEFDDLRGVSGMARRLLSRVMGMTVANQKKLIGKLKSSDQVILGRGSRKIAAKSLRELLNLDARGLFAQVTCPVLLIGGEKDIQCDPADVGEIAALCKGVVSAQVVQNLTHVLRFDEGQPSFLRTGDLIKKPMEPLVLALIGSWLKGVVDKV